MALVPLFQAPVVYTYDQIREMLDANFDVSVVGVLREVHLVGHREHYKKKTKAELGKAGAVAYTVAGCTKTAIPMDLWLSFGVHLTTVKAEEILDWLNQRLWSGRRS